MILSLMDLPEINKYILDIYNFPRGILSTVKRRQRGKVPTPFFVWFGQGLTVKDPLSLSEEGDEQWTQSLPRFGPPGG